MISLKLKRQPSTSKSTMGELFINGEFFCYTLEDVEREKKIYGETAIPRGIYKVILSYSPKFKRVLPMLLDVPDFSGIRIHRGVHAGHTEGCILVGFSKGVDEIYHNKVAEEKLVETLSTDEDIEIEVC